MEKNKSLSWNFTFEAIPLLFHKSTDTFMRYLDKDGKNFLIFYWNYVGDMLSEEKRVSPAGLGYNIEQVDKNTKLVIITLPTPKEDGDPYFLALVARPERRFFFVRLPNTESYVLHRDDQSVHEDPYRVRVSFPTRDLPAKGRGGEAEQSGISKSRLE